MRLETDYLDLLLLHWPDPDVPLDDTLAAMDELKSAGLIRHLGVSNFPAWMLRHACNLAPVFCNQVEYHPFLRQEDVLAVAEEYDLCITAHSPLAGGRVNEDDTLRRIAAKHCKTPIQVALRWLIDQPRVCAIPMATTHEWRAENWDIHDFALSKEERSAIDELPKDTRVVDPPWAVAWDR
jgi:2,5-diketo-D-gluconate reductase B